MQLTIPFHIPASPTKIKLKDTIFSIGSCFSDKIGQILLENKMDVYANPFGTIFNPISIFKILQRNIDTNRTIQNNEVYYHWDAHSSIASLDKSTLQKQIIKEAFTVQKKLKNCDWLIITFGSAWVYRLKQDHELVANCHKIPANYFTKELITPNAIIQSFDNCYQELKTSNPNLKIILTVSPVRHIKDGLVENNRSKASLLTATHELVAKYADVSYFPAYEIIMDELRDYRFYKKDRVHPNPEAVQYVWEQFLATYFDEPTQMFVKEWKKIKAAISHRPFYPNTQQHQLFLRKTIEQLQALSERVNISNELNQLKSQLIE